MKLFYCEDRRKVEPFNGPFVLMPPPTGLSSAGRVRAQENVWLSVCSRPERGGGSITQGGQNPEHTLDHRTDRINIYQNRNFVT